MADTEIGNFYNELQTVPKLVSDLALSIAEAQRRLDHDYLENLAEYVRLMATVSQMVPSDAANPNRFPDLFRTLAPSHYQFTETVLEVRADLQMGKMEELGLKADVGIKASVFAVAINASYTKRSAYDAHASALIRTTLNAIAADSAVMDKLLPRAGEVPHAPAPITGRYAELAKAFTELMKIAPRATPGATPAGGGTAPAQPGGTPLSP
jgi:hypothetical protein